MKWLKGMKAAYIVACVALVVLFGTLASAQEKMPQVLFTNVNIFVGKADKLADGMSLLVEGKISSGRPDDHGKGVTR
jgi:hypothetical protein